MGAGRVISIDLAPERLNFAQQLGADATVLAGKGDTVQEVHQLTEGYGADVVIEAIGLPTTWEQAVQMVRKGGRVLEFGGCPPGTKIKVPTDILHYGEVTMLGTFHATPTHFKKALNLIATKTLNVKQLITRKMKLEHIREAFESLSTSKDDIKIAIIP
jgi:L-iditol 2-dehydrogenase